ncbi:MAG: ABC transporter ATP-binding protein [bacterium]|nr:ABC transporter ATP-binding protein [bacterium]MDT8366984.1 ABC transporter ATP-binding protein [bacterium]
MTVNPLIDVKNLEVQFEVRGVTLRAVDDVSFTIAQGETLGLVGESGCGKSVTASAIMRLVPQPPGRISGGQILFDDVDLLKLTEKQMRGIRGNRISMIFQEPMSSLNPVYTVGDQVAEVIELHQKLKRREAMEKVVEVFGQVGIPDPGTRVKDHPHKMSGGMRQRVMIAMALACNPRLMIADEPTTALDVTIQAQILVLMNDLKEKTGASILFITHDLSVIAEMAQRVAVMYAGKMMEYAAVTDLFDNPKHPYTVGLMTSVPALSKGKERLTTIPGVVPSLFNIPEGCPYYDRCPEVRPDCEQKLPAMIEVDPGHFVRCWNYNN